MISFLGWVLAFKGFAYLLLPQSVKFFAGWTGPALRICIRTAGAVLALVGIYLCYSVWSSG